MSALTKEELWKIFSDKNPSFNDPDGHVTMTARGLRKLFDQTYDTAHAKGFKNGVAMEQMAQETKRKRNPFGGLFG